MNNSTYTEENIDMPENNIHQKSIDELTREEYVQILHEQQLVPDFSKLTLPGKWYIVNTTGIRTFLYKDGDYFFASSHLPNMLEPCDGDYMASVVAKSIVPFLTLVPPIEIANVLAGQARAKELWDEEMNKMSMPVDIERHTPIVA